MIALVLGGAATLAADLQAARRLVCPTECVIVACNDAGFEWPGRLDHWATLHPEELAHRIRVRAERGYPDGFETWTRPYPAGMKERERLVDHTLDGYDDGSSGLLALGVALHVGCHAILCGVPMDPVEHFNRDGEWSVAEKYRVGWEPLASDRRARIVRSMSGWTREVFGAPTHEWVDEARSAGVASVLTGAPTGAPTN